jgi:hypothetical protein
VVETNSKIDLKKHMPMEQATNKDIRSEIVCNICNKTFEGRWNFMNHRRDNHPIVKKCINNQDGKCKFGAGSCWYNHGTISAQGDDDTFKCYGCNIMFKVKSHLMKHRRDEHIDKTPLCKNGSFCFYKENCWWKYQNKNQDFRLVLENFAPPGSQNNNIKKEEKSKK